MSATRDAQRRHHAELSGGIEAIFRAAQSTTSLVTAPSVPVLPPFLGRAPSRPRRSLAKAFLR